MNISEKIEKRKIILEELKNNILITQAIKLLENSLKEGNKILILGNGGSACQSSHFSAELINKFYLKRKSLPAISLATNYANITSIANDSDFKYIFSRQIESLGKKDDVAIGLTTSGKSPNIIEALKVAREMNLKTILLCGAEKDIANKLNPDITISIPATDTPIIQEMHLFILHFMAETLEKNLFSENI